MVGTFDVEANVEGSSTPLSGGDLAVVESGVLWTHAVDDQSPLGHAMTVPRRRRAAARRRHRLHGDAGVGREYLEPDRQRMRLVLPQPRHLHANG